MSAPAAARHARLPPLRAAARAGAPHGRQRAPPLSKAQGQYSPQGVFNKRRPAGAGKEALREEWRYQLQGLRQPQVALDELVVVEGFNDMVAVARAVDAEVAGRPPSQKTAMRMDSRLTLHCTALTAAFGSVVAGFRAVGPEVGERRSLHTISPQPQTLYSCEQHM